MHDIIDIPSTLGMESTSSELRNLRRWRKDVKENALGITDEVVDCFFNDGLRRDLSFHMITFLRSAAKIRSLSLKHKAHTPTKGSIGWKQQENGFGFSPLLPSMAVCFSCRRIGVMLCMIKKLKEKKREKREERL